MILPTADRLGLRAVSLSNGSDEGCLFERLHKDVILLVRYDLERNIITTSEDSTLCVMDRQFNRRYIEMESPVVSFVQSKDKKYMFTGSKDMRVTLWHRDWTKLCFLSSPVRIDRLQISQNDEFLFAIPFGAGEKSGKL